MIRLLLNRTNCVGYRLACLDLTFEVKDGITPAGDALEIRRSSQSRLGGRGRRFNHEDFGWVPERQCNDESLTWTEVRRYPALDPAEC
jgi:hypothetical protein